MNAKLKQRIQDNLATLDTGELYENMLNECYGEVEIAGYSFSTSRALRKLDPTAFRCGLVDYIDSLSLVEIDGDYFEFDACDAERDELISELESKVDELQGEIDQINDDILDGIKTLEDGESEIREINSKIAALNEEIAEINNSL